MIRAEGPSYTLAPGLDLCQVLLGAGHLTVLQAAIKEQNTGRRLAFLIEMIRWPVILEIAMGVSPANKAAVTESAFRSGRPGPLVDYFSNLDLLKHHTEIAHTLYWTLRLRRIKIPRCLPEVVMKFFRPATATSITTEVRLNVVKRILDCVSPGLQPEAFSVAVAFCGNTNAFLNKRYKVMKNDEALREWAEQQPPQPWDIPDDSDWNLSRIWWTSCCAYVEAMLTIYDVHLDFSHHSVHRRYSNREVVAVLSIGSRLIYDVVQNELGGQSAMDHCIQWMTGTEHARYTNALTTTNKCPVIYGDVIRVLFFRKLHIQTQFDAAASRGITSWAEGDNHCGYLVYLEK